MEKYVLSVCLAADLNYELKTMLHQHQARLDICDSLERAEERIGKQRFCLVVCDTTALPTCQALLCLDWMRKVSYTPILLLAPVGTEDNL